MTEAFSILLENLELLECGEVKRLARLVKGTPDDVMEMLGIIRTLNPKPGEKLWALIIWRCRVLMWL